MVERVPKRTNGRRKADHIAGTLTHFVKLGMQVLAVIAGAFVTGIGLLVTVHAAWLAFTRGLI